MKSWAAALRGRGLNLAQRGAGLAQRDIGRHALIEQHRFLGDHADGGAQASPGSRHRMSWPSTAMTPLFGIIEAQQQVEDGALAGAGRTHQRYLGAGGNVQRRNPTRSSRRIGMIGKADMARKPTAPPLAAKGCVAPGRLTMWGRASIDCEDAVGRRRCRLTRWATAATEVAQRLLRQQQGGEKAGKKAFRVIWPCRLCQPAANSTRPITAPRNRSVTGAAAARSLTALSRGGQPRFQPRIHARDGCGFPGHRP